MSKKFRFLAGGVLALSSLAAPQTAHALVDFGIKGGVGISTYSVDASTVSASSAFGYLAGLGIDFNLLPVGILVDVLYAHRSVDMTLPVVGKQTSSINQLYIPVQADFSLGPIFISGGAYYGLGIGDATIGGSSVSYASAGLKKSDWGLVLGLGAKVMSFSVEARYNLGLANVSDTSGVSSKTRSFDVLLGYWF